MRERKQILMDIVSLNGNLSTLKEELANYQWDSKVPVLNILNQDLVNVFKRCIDDRISLENLVAMANIIECRDDIEFQNEEMQEVIFELANPEINGEITKEKLQKIINELEYGMAPAA